MDKLYCKAPLVSTSIFPGNKITPCCLWNEAGWKTVDDMRTELVGRFKKNNIPSPCQGCNYRHEFDAFPLDKGLQMLDIRNDNLCNLRCRSCTPMWSSRIALEEEVYPVRNYLEFNLDQLQWNNIKSVYICGGEPFISGQHEEILKKIKKPKETHLHYNTNCTTLYHHKKYIPDLWTDFLKVTVNVSIDAVGPAAEVVRSGCRWKEVNKVLTEFENLDITLCVTPYMSALNIWWIDTWLERFSHWNPEQIRPIISGKNDPLGLDIIPYKFRPKLIDILTRSKFSKQFIGVVNLLKKSNNTALWIKFVERQQEIDSNRQEHWTKLFEQKKPYWNG
tara:strand:+ start:275 stop:1276 length:1002 start_codon:yes stop_codon:yes gene_type:complete